MYMPEYYEEHDNDKKYLVKLIDEGCEKANKGPRYDEAYTLWETLQQVKKFLTD